MKKLSRGSFQGSSEAFVAALVMAILIRGFFFQAFEIPSGSMEPTLLIGDHILVNKFVMEFESRLPIKDGPSFASPASGDVVVFVYPVDRSKDFIKRVIAVGGDTVEIRDKKVLINGEVTKDTSCLLSERHVLSRTCARRR